MLTASWFLQHLVGNWSSWVKGERTFPHWVVIEWHENVGLDDPHHTRNNSFWNMWVYGFYFLYGDTTYKYLGHNFPSDFTVCVRQVSSAQIPIVERTRVSGHTWVSRSEYNIDVNGFFYCVSASHTAAKTCFLPCVWAPLWAHLKTTSANSNSSRLHKPSWKTLRFQWTRRFPVEEVRKRQPC